MNDAMLLADAQFVAVDVEGNGAKPSEIVEIALVPFTLRAKGVSFESLVRPTEPISRLVQRKHGISNDAVRAAPRFAQLADSVMRVLEGRILVAHRASVEVALLSELLEGWRPVGVVDTLALARGILRGLDSYSLVAVAKALGLRPADQRHRALPDAHLAADVLTALIQRSGATTLSQLQGLARSSRASTSSAQLSIDEPPASMRIR